MMSQKVQSEAPHVIPKPLRKKSTFAGDVIKIVSGTAFAQLIGFFASPILTRCYAPEAFGLFALFTSITTILGVIACLRYELSIMLPDNDEDAANLLGVCLLSTIIVSLLTIPIIWFGNDLITKYLNAPDIKPYLWLIPVAVFLLGTFLALNYWNSRTKHFGRLSIARVGKSLADTSLQISLGLSGFATGGSMICSGIGGQAIATTVLGRQIWHDDGKFLLKSISWKQIVQGLKRYCKFPIYSSWSALLSSIAWQLPAFMLAGFFSSAVVGYYALGFRTIRLPMNLIGNSIGQVFFQRATEAKAQGNLSTLVEKVFRQLVMFSMYPVLMLALVGKPLFAFIFGANWAEAGVYTQILAVWSLFWFISSPLDSLLSVLEKQEFGLQYNIILLITRIGSLAIGGYLNSPRIALVLFSLTGAVLSAYLNTVIVSSAGVPVKDVIKIIGKGFLYFFPFGLLTGVSLFFHISTIVLIIEMLLFAGLYGFVLWKSEPQLFSRV